MKLPLSLLVIFGGVAAISISLVNSGHAWMGFLFALAVFGATSIKTDE